jgi:steroid 5-alpha reductase family enzyme
MIPFELLLWTAAGAAVLMTVLWLVQVITRDATIVDVGWATGLCLAALFFGLVGGTGDFTRRVVFTVLAGGWALRLALYLYINRVHGRAHEDGRYQRMRAAMGRWANAGFFAFFHAQTLFVVIFAVPFIAPVLNASPFGVWDVLGIIIWLVALSGECIADAQLAAFRARPENAGTTCMQGLWRYSRHPNYFFEWLHWFAYICLSIGGAYWWLSLTGPVIMFVFLYKVTGIPHTEKQALSHRPDYAEYQQTTSMFIPWFSKRRRQEGSNGLVE